MTEQHDTPDVAAKKSRARGRAEARLRDAHRDELFGYIQEEMTKEGVNWQPRLTEEERAERQIEDLLNRHPSLREKYDTPGEYA